MPPSAAAQTVGAKIASQFSHLFLVGVLGVLPVFLLKIQNQLVRFSYQLILGFSKL